MKLYIKESTNKINTLIDIISLESTPILSLQINTNFLERIKNISIHV